jgi:hypothetical protein
MCILSLPAISLLPKNFGQKACGDFLQNPDQAKVRYTSEIPWELRGVLEKASP